MTDVPPRNFSTGQQQPTRNLSSGTIGQGVITQRTSGSSDNGLAGSRGIDRGERRGTRGTFPSPTDSIAGTGNAIDEVVADFPALRALLASYGFTGAELEEVYQAAVTFITEGMSDDRIELELRQLDAVRDRFATVFDREENGLSAVSFADVINYENEVARALTFYGVPDRPGLDPQSITRELMGSRDTSVLELTTRLEAQRVFAREVLEDPDQDTQAIEALLGQGVTLFDIAEYALDPVRTLEELSRRLEAASVASEAAQRDYRLTNEEALELARQGVTNAQAEEGFGALRLDTQVIDALNNEVDPVSREQELAAVAGDVEAQAAIEAARRRRLAAFAEGGSFARDDEGFSGLR